jgi:hypothetical protein
VHIEFTYTPGIADAHRMVRTVMRGRFRQHAVLGGFYLLLAIGAAVLGIVEDDTLLTILAPTVLMAGALYYGGQYWLAPARIVRASPADYLGPVAVRLDPEGFQVDTSGLRQSGDWAVVDKVVDSGGFWLVRGRGRLLFALPQRLLDPALVTQVRTFFASQNLLSSMMRIG